MDDTGRQGEERRGFIVTLGAAVPAMETAVCMSCIQQIRTRGMSGDIDGDNDLTWCVVTIRRTNDA